MQIDPRDLLEDFCFGLAGEFAHREKNQVNTAAAWIIVLIAGEFTARHGLNGQFLAQFADERLLRRFAVFYFAAGKLPLQGMPVAFSPLPDQHLPVSLDYARGDEQWWPGSAQAGVFPEAINWRST